MIDSIIEIGGAVLTAQDKLSSLIKEVPPVKRKKQQHVCKFIFDTKNHEMHIDVLEEIDDNTASRYLHVGSVDGPRSPQWYATSTGSAYILSEFFPNIANLSIKIDEDIKEKARVIIEEFFTEIGEEFARDKKYCFMLDVEKLGISQGSINELKNQASAADKPGKKLLELVQKELKNHLQEKYGLNDTQIGLYTVLVDDVPLATNESYRKAVVESKSPKSNNKKNRKFTKKLECNICGSSEGVPSDLSKMKIKYFTTNQIIFSSRLQKNYDRSLNLCNACVEKLQAGEIFLQQHLSTRIAGFDVYVVPHLVYGEALDAQTLENITRKLMVTLNMAKSIEGIDDFRDRVEQLKDFENIYYLIDFVFVRTSNAATKVLRLVKDIRPSFFEKLHYSVAELKATAERHFGQRYRYRGGLETVYYLTPIRLKQGNASSFRDLLAFYDAIFTGRDIDERRVIKNLAECLAIVGYGKEGYNVRIKPENINYLVLDGVFYLEFLRKMGCLKGGGEMDVNALNLDENIKNYLLEMNYDEQKTAMFLLGYMVGQVGNAQYRRFSDSGGDGNYKPVLNKLNFNGIDKSKLIRLRSDIFNKLRQEKILMYNEKIFAVCSRLMDKNLGTWNLNKDENLFYLLSGYAFATTVPRKKKEEKSDE